LGGVRAFSLDRCETIIDSDRMVLATGYAISLPVFEENSAIAGKNLADDEEFVCESFLGVGDFLECSMYMGS
jgi:hypothetical protein